MCYIITEINPTDEHEALAWSSADGWCSENYDTFDETERQTLTLPITGQWEPVQWTKQ